MAPRPRSATRPWFALGPGVLLVAYALLGLGACGGGTNTSAQGQHACVANRDCGAGSACVAGLCMQGMAKSCTSDSACPSGQLCDLASGQCAAKPGAMTP